MAQKHHTVTWAVILVFSAAVGIFFTTFVTPEKPMIGTIFGIFMGVPVLAFLRGLFLPGMQQRLARLPFPLYVPASIAIYTTMIVISGELAGAAMWMVGMRRGSFLASIELPLIDVIGALVMLALIIFVLRVKDLIGAEVFFSLLRGRYHKPVREERIFLFIDVVGSTQFAERFGDLRTQEFLGQFFATLAEPVRRYQGAIDDYVGDLAIVTWPLRRGADEARCVRCVFALLGKIARETPFWQAKFGVVPRFRAAIHGGPVVAGEIGVDRRKISYFGDTVNATARLESLCRELDAPILISAELLSRINALPREVSATHLGTHDVRGRDHPIAVAALSLAAEPQQAAARLAA